MAAADSFVPEGFSSPYQDLKKELEKVKQERDDCIDRMRAAREGPELGMGGEVMSAFDKWFKAQHGPRRRSKRSDHELQSLVLTGDMAREELLRRHEWDVRRESALYAWQAREPARCDFCYGPMPCCCNLALMHR